jgi:hypothetical protein
VVIFNRTLKKELGFSLLGLEYRSHAQTAQPTPAKVETKTRKRKREKNEDSDSEDEVSTFRARPTAKTNRPMIIPPVDTTRKRAIELSMAQVDPNASFAERVAQFDTMEAIAKKRKLQSTPHNCSCLSLYVTTVFKGTFPTSFSGEQHA